MTEIPMEGMDNMPSDMPSGMSSNKPNNKSNNQESKDPDQVAVEKGSDLALQAEGVPPPLSTMAGKEIGKKYKEVKDGLDPGKQIEKGLNNTLGAADIMSQGAQPKEAADGMDAAKKGTKNTTDNVALLSENPVQEMLNHESQPTEKQAAKAEEGAEVSQSKKPGMT